jgi:hypothetical protein
MRICVITYYFKVGGGTWGTALYTVEVWVLGVGMSTPGAQTALYAEDRGLQVPMALEHGPVTSSGQAAPGPDPRIRHRIQIGMFRPIRLDHTNCLQVAIKTHSFRNLLPLPHHLNTCSCNSAATLLLQSLWRFLRAFL